MQASPECYRRYRQTPVPYKRSKACTYGTSICSLADDGTPFDIGDFSVHRHKVQIPIFYFFLFLLLIIIYLSVFIKQRLPGKGIVVYGIWISLFFALRSCRRRYSCFNFVCQPRNALFMRFTTVTSGRFILSAICWAV